MTDHREVICGMMGDIHWQPVLPASGLEGLLPAQLLRRLGKDTQGGEFGKRGF